MSHGERGCVLALDIGTSSARASLYDMQGQPVPSRFTHTTYSPRVSADGGAEFDPRWLLAVVSDAIDRLLAEPAPGPILAVAIGSFWHSLMGLGADHQPLTPVFAWLDARSRSVLPDLRERLDERAVHARTGCVLHWTYWPAKLMWLQGRDADGFDNVKHWVGFGDYLLHTLTGSDTTSVSMASGTGLLDVHRCVWDDAMLDVAGISRDALPRLVDVDEPGIVLNPTYAARWPALAGVPWLPAVGDGASSNLGAGCTTERDIAIMIGTSGAERVLRLADGPFTIPWGVWCYRLDRRHVVLGGAINDGGALIDWLDRSLSLGPRNQRDRAVAAIPPDSHGLTVLPLWGGERSPNWSDDARGGVVGLRLKTSPTDVLRASMEAVALLFADIDCRLQNAGTSTSSEVVGTGGALLHSPAWLQIMADVLQRPVLASAENEATGRGVSLLALRRLGVLGEPLSTLRPRARRRYAPRPEFAETYHKAGERQRRLYDALVP